MSLSALRNTTTAGRRNFAPGTGVDSHGQQEHDDASWRRSAEHSEVARSVPATSAVVLEPHWQASIEIATD